MDDIGVAKGSVGLPLRATRWPDPAEGLGRAQAKRGELETCGGCTRWQDSAWEEAPGSKGKSGGRAVGICFGSEDISWAHMDHNYVWDNIIKYRGAYSTIKL